jgi:hypothetical protein
MVINNIVQDTWGADIGLWTGDYFIIAGNVVYNTTSGSIYAESGICVYEPVKIPGFSPICHGTTDIIFRSFKTWCMTMAKARAFRSTASWMISGRRNGLGTPALNLTKALYLGMLLITTGGTYLWQCRRL